MTLRNGVWKKIPNNTLAEGDIIKLLPEESAPALVVCLKDTSEPFLHLLDEHGRHLNENKYQGANVDFLISEPQLTPELLKSKSKTELSQTSEHLFFNKGQKIAFKKYYGGNFRGKDNQVSLDPSEAL